MNNKNQNKKETDFVAKAAGSTSLSVGVGATGFMLYTVMQHSQAFGALANARVTPKPDKQQVSSEDESQQKAPGQSNKEVPEDTTAELTTEQQADIVAAYTVDIISADYGDYAAGDPSEVPSRSPYTASTVSYIAARDAALHSVEPVPAAMAPVAVTAPVAASADATASPWLVLAAVGAVGGASAIADSTTSSSRGDTSAENQQAAGGDTTTVEEGTNSDDDDEATEGDAVDSAEVFEVAAATQATEELDDGVLDDASEEEDAAQELAAEQEAADSPEAEENTIIWENIYEMDLAEFLNENQILELINDIGLFMGEAYEPVPTAALEIMGIYGLGTVLNDISYEAEFNYAEEGDPWLAE